MQKSSRLLNHLSNKSMSVKSLEVKKIRDKTGNIYKSLVVIAKRARQISANEKLELDEKLKYFEGYDDEDDFSFNEEQERISKEFEKKLHPTQRAIGEFLDGDVYYKTTEEV